jgi:type II secretory pathway component PulC
MKERNKLIILLILSVFAIFSIYNGITKSSKTKRKESSFKIDFEKKDRDFKGRKKTVYSQWGRSPFLPSEYIKKTTSLVLNGILWDRDNPQAVINGKIVKVGSKIDSKEVIEIKEDRVILSDGTKIFELKLK